MGRDQLDQIGEYSILIVSTHAPAWGATQLFACKDDLSSFNPRARMGRDRGNLVLENLLYCFNPRARMGRDALILILYL